jgi:PAS domain S-box-containing protein
MTDLNSRIPERIREELRKNPKGLTITDIATRIEINRNSTARYLDVLQFSGQVEMRKVGPAKLYFLSQRVPLEAMLNLSKNGILTFDSELKVIRVNDAFTKIVEIETTDLLGSRLDRVGLPGLSKEEFLHLFRESAEGKQIDFETTVQDKEKTTHLGVKLVPTTFDDGSTGATIILEDITKRKQSEEEIKRQHDFLRLVMESVAHPFYVIDVNDYTIKMANRAARLGILTDDSTCYSLTHGSNKPCTGNIHPCPLKQVVETKKPAVVQHIHHQVSGKTRHVEIHAHPIFDDTSNVVQVIEYNLDITDRKQVEADLCSLLDMYQLIVENIESALFVLQDNCIVYCNSAFSRKLGYDVHEMTGAELWKFITTSDRKNLAKTVSDLESGKSQTKLYSFSLMNNKSQSVRVDVRIALSKYAGSPAWVFNILEIKSTTSS